MTSTLIDLAYLLLINHHQLISSNWPSVIVLSQLCHTCMWRSSLFHGLEPAVGLHSIIYGW